MMELKKLKKVGHELGLTSMMCASVDEYIVIYGGSNFPNGTPPNGTRKCYNDFYIYDKDFNLLSKGIGKIEPDSGITLTYNNSIYFISGANNTKIYRYRVSNSKLIEEELIDIGEEIVGGYGVIFDNKIFFGKEYIYEYDIAKNKITKKSKFIGEPRSQSINFESDGYLYLFSGASNISYLDSYRYDILNDKWEKLDILTPNLTGASCCKLDEHNILIIGGCNKGIYDDAVKKLSNIEFKKEYFSREREDFKWNKDIYVYNTKNSSFNIIGGNIENATCGSTLLKIDNKIYLINGEIKPGTRSPYVLEGEIL